MKSDFGVKVTGCAFVLAGVMLWLGFFVLPHRVGTFFVPGDFAAIHAQFHLWIWIFRVHIFGMVIAAMALAALAALVAEHPARVLVWSGAAVAVAGHIVGAVGAAFYYHSGAWGALETTGKGDADLQSFVAALRVATEYVTCLVRFACVFSGLGFVILAWGALKSKMLNGAVGLFVAAIGVASMGVTMAWPDSVNTYHPLFRLQYCCLLAVGLDLLVRGYPRETAPA